MVDHIEIEIGSKHDLCTYTLHGINCLSTFGILSNDIDGPLHSIRDDEYDRLIEGKIFLLLLYV